MHRDLSHLLLRRVAIAVLFSTLALIDVRAQAAQPAQSKTPTPTVTLTTKPAPPVTGDNEFIVAVTGPDKKPLVGADVTVTLVMPAVPSMNMPEMKNSVTLKPVSDKPADAGKYTGKGQIAMAGKWNVVVTVKQQSKTIAEQKLTLAAK